MPVQVFRLKGVPEDEAEEVRTLLKEQGVDFYETQDRGWGVSMPAIWIRDESQQDRVKALVDGYQRERAQRMRALYEQRRLSGELPGFWAHPLRNLIYLAIVLVVLFFSIRPFFF